MDTASYSKKDHILEKASSMITKLGIHILSMDDIANECGVSKRTIYTYFQNKADLINHILDTKTTDFKATIENMNMNSGNAIVALHCFFENYKKAITTYSPTFLRDINRYNLNISLKFSRINTDIILPFVFDNIDRGQKEGLYKQDLDKEELSESILNMLGYIFTDNSLIHIENAFGTFDFFKNLLMHRLVTVTGLNMLNAVNRP